MTAGWLLPRTPRSSHTVLAGTCWALSSSGQSAPQVRPPRALTSPSRCALSIKMSALLYLPGLLVILFKRHGLLSTLGHVLGVVLIQGGIGAPFLVHNWRTYLRYSYEFSRAFLYKWTVNWRFVSEEAFLSAWWARGLLFGHLATLVAFGLSRWCRRDGGVWTVVSSGLRRPSYAPSAVPMTADCTSILILSRHNMLNRWCRCYNSALYIQLDWHLVCAVIALSISFMVRSPAAIHCLEDKIPGLCKVSNSIPLYDA